jgi:GNAT superfamily N-acetyltransferase
MEILFRQLNEPVASWSVSGLRWSVEVWDEEMAYPIAQAWVTVPQYDVLEPYIDWLHVDERFQRKRHGTKLLQAILERWPNAVYDGATKAGKAFLKAFQLERVQ